MPVKKRKAASKLNKKKIGRRKPVRRGIKAAARKPARQAAKRVAIQSRREAVAPPEPPIEILEVVETEIYEEPVIVRNGEELN